MAGSNSDRPRILGTKVMVPIQLRYVPMANGDARRNYAIPGPGLWRCLPARPQFFVGQYIFGLPCVSKYPQPRIFRTDIAIQKTLVQCKNLGQMDGNLPHRTCRCDQQDTYLTDPSISLEKEAARHLLPHLGWIMGISDRPSACTR